MTPTADLMKLARYSPMLADPGDDRRPWATMASDPCGDYVRLRDVEAALSASRDARVGGEVVRYECRRSRQPSGWTDWVDSNEESHDEIIAGHWDNPDTGRAWESRALVVATPAQPKASEGKAGGEFSDRLLTLRTPGWNFHTLDELAAFVADTIEAATLTAPGADDGQ